jgi:hypothetical protein
VVGIEERGIPVTLVMWIYPGLDDITKNACDRAGMPAMMKRIFYIKSDYHPNVRAQYDIQDLIDLITRPLTEEEKQVGVIPRVEPPRIATKGTYDEIIRFFHGDRTTYPSGGPFSHWTDGLPIVPPTEKRVAEMLRGTSHAPDELVGLIQPEGWEATVEKVAINGVMAGCKPEHMPVLLAMTELGVSNSFASPCSFSKLWAVSGPYGQEIEMNSGMAVMSPGNEANATIGRAAALMAINLGGNYPTVNVIKQYGNPADYSCCFAETPDDMNPWSSLREDWGYMQSDSLLLRYEGFWMSYLACSSGTKPLKGFEELPTLNNLIGMIKNEHMSMGSLFLMTPDAVKGYIEMGFKTKESLQEWLWHNATQTKKEWLAGYWFVYEGNRIEPAGSMKTWNMDMLNWPDEAEIPVCPSPKHIGVMVTGGTGHFVANIQLAHPKHTSIDKWR